MGGGTIAVDTDKDEDKEEFSIAGSSHQFRFCGAARVADALTGKFG